MTQPDPTRRGLSGRPSFCGPGGGVMKSNELRRDAANPLGFLRCGGVRSVIVVDLRLRPAPLGFFVFRGRPLPRFF